MLKKFKSGLTYGNLTKKNEVNTRDGAKEKVTFRFKGVLLGEGAEIAEVIRIKRLNYNRCSQYKATLDKDGENCAKIITYKTRCDIFDDV